jgi:hypothetical protein
MEHEIVESCTEVAPYELRASMRVVILPREIKSRMDFAAAHWQSGVLKPLICRGSNARGTRH